MTRRERVLKRMKKIEPLLRALYQLQKHIPDDAKRVRDQLPHLGTSLTKKEAQVIWSVLQAYSEAKEN